MGLSLLILEGLVSPVEEFGMAIGIDLHFGMIDTVDFLFDTVAFLVEGFELLLIGGLVFLQGVEYGFSLV